MCLKYYIKIYEFLYNVFVILHKIDEMSNRYVTNIT